jgi:hypothetical protein
MTRNNDVRDKCDDAYHDIDTDNAYILTHNVVGVLEQNNKESRECRGRVAVITTRIIVMMTTTNFVVVQTRWKSDGDDRRIQIQHNNDDQKRGMSRVSKKGKLESGV